MTIDFQNFCLSGPCRYSLESPFVVDGWEYATDGAIIVRRKTRKLNTIGRALPPKVAEQFSKWTADGMRSVPNRKEFLSDKCEECGGTGTHVCGECGHNAGKCDLCGGTGKESAWLGTIAISSRNFLLIQRLPNPKYLCGDDRVFFASGNVQGAVMCMAHPDTLEPITRTKDKVQK